MRSYLLSFLFLFVFGLSSNAQCPNSNRQGIHVVQPNENLYRIAQRYNVTLLQIGEWNNLTIGQVIPMCTELKVGEPTTYAPTASDVLVERTVNTTNFVRYQKQPGKMHVVQPGETFADLAELYGYTERRFREINPIGQEVTPGSILLSTDCDCNRISYDSNTPSSYNTNSLGTAYASSSNAIPAEYNNTTPSTGMLSRVVDGANTSPNTLTSNNAIINRPAPSSSNTNSANYLNAEEKSMLDEINFMRANPAGYVQYVQQYVQAQKNNNGFPIDDRVVTELIKELQVINTLSQLSATECIYNAAKNHGRDLLQRGKTDHQGSDGSWPWDRVRNACPQMQDGNENLVGGPASVREAVIILLIDEGIANRGHRKTLLNPNWKYAAAFKIGQVGGMPNCWVQKFGN